MATNDNPEAHPLTQKSALTIIPADPEKPNPKDDLLPAVPCRHEGRLLYVMTFISVTYLILQLTMSHLSHSLTLQVDSYHMLYNILSLSGSIIAIKVSILCNNFYIIDISPLAAYNVTSYTFPYTSS